MARKLRTGRPSKLETMMRVAQDIAEQSTCARRAVGCVGVDGHYRISATGYNGVDAGATHCIDAPCAGACMQSGTGLDECEAIHAEQNMIAHCSDIKLLSKIFCTTFPCITCMKQLLNTSATELYVAERYPGYEKSLAKWKARGRRAFIIDAAIGPYSFVEL